MQPIQAREVLFKNEELLWFLLTASAEALLVTDDMGALVYVSPNACALFKADTEELFPTGKISDLLGENLIDPEELNGTGEIRDIERRIVSAGGEERILLVDVRRNMSGRGSILFACRDVTALKRAEQVLRNHARMKKEFLLMAGHELRTPLTVVHGYVELLLMQPEIDAETRQQYLNLVLEQTRDLTRITNDLLDLSRIQSDRGLGLSRRVVPLKELVERATRKILRKIPPHRIAVRLPQSPIRLFVDDAKMALVIEKLLDNAVKYSPADGKIILRGRQKGRELLFVIEDEGIGMAPEQCRRAFEPFYRADNSNTSVPGFGLGLSLAREIVEEHGGSIWLESAPGRGTKVYFTASTVGDHAEHG